MSTTTTTTNNTESSSSSKMWWLAFIISTALCIYMIMFIDEWFWLTLPFVFTSIVKALDVI